MGRKLKSTRQPLHIHLNICLYLHHSLSADQPSLSPSLSEILEFFFNTSLSFENHVNSVCKSIFLEPHRISCFSRLLFVAPTKQLMSAFVLFRLSDSDCNSVHRSCLSPFDKLQRAQNSAALIVLCKRKADHATPHMHDLYWLPV